jgi:hypothetical protein
MTESFRDHVEQAAHDEAVRVIRELEEVREKAGIVAGVLRALELGIPSMLRWLENGPELSWSGDFVAEPEDIAEPAEPPDEPKTLPADLDLVPPELRVYPGAESGGPLKQRIRTADLQRYIVVTITQHTSGPFLAEEVHDLFVPCLRRKLIVHHLGRLADQGHFLRRTGRRRLSKDRRVGRAGVEYELLGAEIPTAAETVAVTPSMIAAARDVIVSNAESWAGRFSYRAVMQALKVMPDEARALCEELAGQDIIRIAPGDSYVYERPTEPGAAAEAQQRLSNEHAVDMQSVSRPVPGTGRQLRLSPAMADLKERCEATGKCTVRETSDGHLAFRVAGRGTPVYAGAKTGQASLEKTRKRLRDLGMPV